jgi:putative chitinase
MITQEKLSLIVPTCSDKLLTLYTPFIDAAMKEFEINTYLRSCAFIAQIAHETGAFHYLREIWGPSAQQLKYENSIRLANQLGNSQKGDGFKFRGRGAIMITGRANYEHFGKQLGVDLIVHPELAESQVFAFRIAGLFWKEKGLNKMADNKEFEQITRRINGGLNGYPERLKYYEKAKEVLLV